MRVRRWDGGCTSERPSNTGARMDELFKLDLSHLAPAEQQSLRALLVSYSDVFTLDSSELGSTAIDTGDH